MEQINFESMPTALAAILENQKRQEQLIQKLIFQTQTSDDKDVFITLRQGAQISNIAEQTLRIKVMQNEIKSHKVGGRRLLKKSEFLDWLDNGGQR